MNVEVRVTAKLSIKMNEPEICMVLVESGQSI